MRLWTRIAAVVAFAGTAVVGARTGADNMGIVNLGIAGQNATQTWLRVDVGPDAEGMPLMVRFGPAIQTGGIIGGTAVHVGTNYVAVPNPQVPGWYTTQLVDGRSAGVENTDPGLN